MQCMFVGLEFERFRLVTIEVDQIVHGEVWPVSRLARALLFGEDCADGSEQGTVLGEHAHHFGASRGCMLTHSSVSVNQISRQ